jgi:phosphatidylglycerophosphate synthase
MQPATLAGARPDAPVSAESYRAVLRRLRAAQKPAGRGAPAYSIYVNRPVGRYIAAAAFKLGATPNQVTAVSAVLTFAAIALLALAPPAAGIGAVVAVLLAAGYAFDSADGQVARLRGGGSAAGEWLDHVVDAVKVVVLHIAVAIVAYRFLLPAGQRGWLLVPLGFAAVASVSFAVFLLNDLLKAARRHTQTTAVIRGGSTPLRSLLGLPTDYGLLIWVFVLLGAPALFFGAYALLFLAQLGYLVLALPKWFRDIAALDQETPR